MTNINKLKKKEKILDVQQELETILKNTTRNK